MKKFLLPAVSIIVLAVFISCNAKTGKYESPLIDTLPTNVPIGKYSANITTDIFNIEKLMPSYTTDTAFHKISGLMIRTGIQKTFYYSVYKMSKKDVIRIFKSLPPEVLTTEANGRRHYVEFGTMDPDYFFNTIYQNDEDNTLAQKYFYGFKERKSFETYGYFTPQYQHVLFIDTSTNMIYHRVRDVIF
jgi:hypothetical protein